MRFSDDFIQKVFEANDLVDLISEVTQLKNASRGLMGRCPFPEHPEKSPSFSVSQSKQVYHCFGCGKSGNIYSFLRDYHGQSFPEAIEFLAGRANISMPVSEVSSEDEQRSRLKKQIHQANQLASQFYRDQLNSSQQASIVQTYVRSRGLSPETLSTFQMGFGSDDSNALEKFLGTKGIPPDAAHSAGLLRKSQRGSGYYDPLRGRLIFPIVKVSGEVIGFGGRILERGEPKYLNSPETPVFSKGKALFGLDQTARFIRSEDQMILVEGYMDLIALYQAGIRNVGATLGTAFTLDHGFVVQRLTKNIVVLFDGDNAGQNAAERSLPLLLQAGLRPKGLVLEDELDPDEFVQEYGAGALKEKLENAPDLFNLIVSRWTQSYKGDSTDKLALIEKTQPLFNAIKETRLRELYLNDLSTKLQIPVAQFKRMIEMGAPPPSPSVEVAKAIADSSETPAPIFLLKGAPRAEKILLSLLLKDQELMQNFILTNDEKNLVDNLQGSGLKNLLQWMLDTYRQKPTVFDRLPHLVALKIDEPGALLEVEKLNLVDEGQSELTALQKMYFDCIKKIRSDFLKKELEDLSRKIKLNPTSEGYIALQQIKKELMTMNTTH